MHHSCYKVRPCTRRSPHDWKVCPYVHPGEHGRRRPLDQFRYDATMCPAARKGEECPLGDACPKVRAGLSAEVLGHEGSTRLRRPPKSGLMCAHT